MRYCTLAAVIGTNVMGHPTLLASSRIHPPSPPIHLYGVLLNEVSNLSSASPNIHVQMSESFCQFHIKFRHAKSRTLIVLNFEIISSLMAVNLFTCFQVPLRGSSSFLCAHASSYLLEHLRRRSQSYITADGQSPVCLGVGHAFGSRDHFPPSLSVFLDS
jgi:hypothetical protein